MRLPVHVLPAATRAAQWTQHRLCGLLHLPQDDVALRHRRSWWGCGRLRQNLHTHAAALSPFRMVHQSWKAPLRKFTAQSLYAGHQNHAQPMFVTSHSGCGARRHLGDKALQVDCARARAASQHEPCADAAACRGRIQRRRRPAGGRLQAGGRRQVGAKRCGDAGGEACNRQVTEVLA